MVKVAVVGLGTIGERIADGLAKQQDMKLVGVADVAPTLPVRALVESGRGYSIYCSLPERIPMMEEAGIPIAGTLDDLLEQVDMVCDATPPGIGMKNKEIYQRHNIPAAFQGGEKHEISPILFSSTANYDMAKDVDYIKLVSCNTTGIVRSVVVVDDAFGVEKSVATIVRRAADPSEIHKGPIDAAIPGKVPAHQATDLMLVMPHVEAMGFIITVPTTHGHVIAMHVTLKKEIATEDALEVFRQGRRIRTFRIDEGFLSNTHIFDYLRDLGVPRADMYEVGIWEETVLAQGRDLYWIHNIPQEAIVIPENIDAIRARMGMQADKWEAVDTTDRYLGIYKG
ncbi:MAG: type II glyceraldehyde-3-phosphate dehydrogenase [Anaerolineales bacterium]|nr:type II glyceraldehyde-3-phosphate dehydrogenase [Anaerolineales bacterium]